MINLIQNGKTKSQIVIAADPAPVEKHAAEELRKFIHQMTTVQLSVTSQPVPGQTNIYIGSSALSLEKLPSELRLDGYVVKTIGQDIMLVGAKPYACLYAVYHLLGKYLGCGFFEDGDQVPCRDAISIPPICDICSPRFPERQFIGQCTVAYGTQWWKMDEWRQWLDYGAKMRFNQANLWYHLHACGLAALVYKRLGLDIEPSDFEKERILVYQEVVRYARLLGMRVVLSGNGIMYHVPPKGNELLYQKYKDTVQFVESDWCGNKSRKMSSLDPMYGRLIALAVEEAIRLFGTDHIYIIEAPSEERTEYANQAEREQMVQGIMCNTIAAIRQIDPQAHFYMDTWCFVAEESDEHRQRNAEALMKVIMEEDITIIDSDVVLCPAFFKKKYFFGRPWLAGILHGGGGCTGLYGYLTAAIQTLQQQIVRNPGANKCQGVVIFPEALNHNHYFYNCLAELAWDPMEVVVGDYLRRFAVSRYGTVYGEKVLPALQALNASAYNTYIPDTMNRAFYRRLGWGWGDAPWLQDKMLVLQEPDIRQALQVMLKNAPPLENSPFFKRDLVDVGKLYLTLRLIEYKRCLLESAKRLHSSTGKSEEEWVTIQRVTIRRRFEHYAQRIIDCIQAMARLAGSIPHYRLATEEKHALRWPQTSPDENLRKVRLERTGLLSLDNLNLLDYYGEDFQELIEFYYLPRVKARIEDLRNGNFEGFAKDMDTGWTGMLMNFTPGSTYPADERIVREFVNQGYPHEKVKFYEGSVSKLAAKLLKQFPLIEKDEAWSQMVLCDVEPTQCHMMPGMPMEFKCRVFNPTASAKKTAITMVMPKGFEAVYDPKVVVDAGQSKTVPINVDANPFDVSPGDYSFEVIIAGERFSRTVTVRQAWQVTSANELQITNRASRAYVGKSLTLSWKTREGRPGAEIFDRLEIPPGVFSRKVAIPANVVPFSGEIRHGDALLGTCWLGKADGIPVWDSLPKQVFCSTSLSSNETKQTDWPDLYGEGSGLLLDRAHPDPAATFRGKHTSKALVFIHHNPHTFFLNILLRDFDYDQPYSDTGPLYKGTAVELGLAVGPEKADWFCVMALTSKGPQVCVLPQDNKTALYVDRQARFKSFLLSEQRMITYHYALDWEKIGMQVPKQIRLGLVIRIKGDEMIELFSGIQNKGNQKDAGIFGVWTLT